MDLMVMVPQVATLRFALVIFINSNEKRWKEWLTMNMCTFVQKGIVVITVMNKKTSLGVGVLITLVLYPWP